MATPNVPASEAAAPERNTRRSYYTPQAVIRDVPGVRRRMIGERMDSFIGSGADLIATGLLTLDMLPGQPGRACSSSRFFPEGTTGCAPGHLEVTVVGVDRFRAVLRVSAEEQARRVSAEDQARRKVETERRQEQERQDEEARQHVATQRQGRRWKTPAELIEWAIGFYGEAEVRRAVQAWAGQSPPRATRSRALPEGWAVVGGGLH